MQTVSPHRPRRLLDPTVGLFVSLYLILLAFFIVMNEISNQETARAVAAMESVGEAFERPYPEAARIPGLDEPRVHPAVDPTFLVEVGELVSSIFGPEAATATTGGNLLEVSIDTHSLFFADAARLSEQAHRFIHRLADLLAQAPPGMRRRASLLFGRTGEEGAVAGARGAALAEALAAAGAPAEAIAVGLLPERSGREMLMEFRSVRRDPAPAADSAAGGAGR